ncbi:hydroxymyristoyl-ACP dehydratase [Lysinibacillus irui]|uniref:Hydroxymyristoyl-ACP dehydratase n=1 Tax=Lysinibacillus irui TaxID=2998077 RepID=A0AAJ5UVH6_9BACI|nr:MULTISPECIES: hydroxymyristoyl-ACP dehydratase [Lysinibacillus]MEA0553203.1 hydroxymyristoyl-ACP dehydratase [Lysinibacillus irui]MEA0975783.1 hydroxymyristoyl-ACP dehydratase [Lysinibacillus irui]MEA1041937.1 hydroxymyristoyl-ACP dehydratase [Lysinibacillus irui]WDV08904.1 hydroxymyristoyl-ACP dehydratase [Lysinibacillus irui]
MLKFHKNILHKKLNDEVYRSYFVIFQQQYTIQEVQYIIRILKLQADEIMRYKPIFITLSGVILSVLMFIAATMNNMFLVGMSLVQLVSITVLSFTITVLMISIKIEKEYKRVQDVIALLDYYVQINQVGSDHYAKDD